MMMITIAVIFHYIICVFVKTSTLKQKPALLRPHVLHQDPRRRPRDGSGADDAVVTVVHDVNEPKDLS